MHSPPFVPLAQRSSSGLASSRQLLLVIAPDWVSHLARLQRFERSHLAATWQPVGKPIAVNLGRSGLAWGRGLHPTFADARAEKREGDACAPAGIFALTALFGYAAPASDLARAARLPYLQATPDLKAIDDPASAYYNRIVDQSALAQPDWATCEDMLRKDQRYAVGAVVAHNAEPPLPGAGSCIFLHVWEREGAPTAGCTAMSLADMTAIAGWLDAAAKPVLVQLPQAEYERWREAWGLPLFPT
jgi:L,D-peptidoglycan transpeptidase YkuD (ErfK/YbiS/YcfS/YnhG family)